MLKDDIQIAGESDKVEICFVSLWFGFETECHCIVQAGLLPPSLGCWGYSCTPKCPVGNLVL